MRKATVIYDSDCGFCRWSLAVLLSAAGRGRSSPSSLPTRRERSAAIGALRPLPLGTAEADQLLADLTVEERRASWHLVIEETASPPLPSASGSPPLRFSAGAALAPAMELVRGGRSPAAAFRRFPRATERGYRWVADHRGQLGRFVPERARRWAGRVIAEHGVGPQ